MTTKPYCKPARDPLSSHQRPLSGSEPYITVDHGEVRYVDDRVGRFLSTLKDLGIYEDSLIVFTSDHGEEHYEHRGIDHGHTLYEELLRVPLIVKLPGSTVKAEIEQTVSPSKASYRRSSICPTLNSTVKLSQDGLFKPSGRTAPLRTVKYRFLALA